MEQGTLPEVGMWVLLKSPLLGKLFKSRKSKGKYGGILTRQIF